MILEFLRYRVVQADLAFLLYFLFVNGFYTLLLMLSLPELWEVIFFTSDADHKRLFHSRVLPGITMIVPAYNEEKTIETALMAILELKYPNLEVVVVNDGSADDTLKRLMAGFELFAVPPVLRRQLKFAPVRGMYRSNRFPSLVVVDKENGGKADALNAGLCAARTPLVCCLDADTLIEPDALLRMVRPFVLRANVVATGGTIRVANGCRVVGGQVVSVRTPWRPMMAIQVVEYLRAFMFGRLGFNRLGGNMVISGAFGLFDRQKVVASGGYLLGTVGEDIELVVRLHRYCREQKIPYLITFVPDPVAWTEVPSNRRMLGRQRERWHRGLMHTVLLHKKMLFNPRYGMAGLVGYPYIVFVELIAPVVEMLGYIGFTVGLWLGWINWAVALFFLVAAWGVGLALSLFAILLEEISFQRYPRFGHTLWLMLMAMFEQFGYRQMTVWWRLKGIFRYFRGHQAWGHMKREGLETLAKTQSARP